MNPARTFGPSIVTCMASSDGCDAAIGDWYWIYYIGPFLASFAVAEVTDLMEWDVDEVPAKEVADQKQDEDEEGHF